MLLATKCPHCKTTFKVANDQLKLQSGLVRCGICHQVFNGIEHLAPTPASTSTIKLNPSAAVAKPVNVDNPVFEPSPEFIAIDPAATTTAELDFDLFNTAIVKPTTSTRVEEPPIQVDVPTRPAVPAEPAAPQPIIEEEPENLAQTELQDVRAQEPPKTEFEHNINSLFHNEDEIQNRIDNALGESIEEINVVQPYEDSDESDLIVPLENARTDLWPVEAKQKQADEDDEGDEVGDEEIQEDSHASDDEDLEQLTFIRQAKIRERMRWLFAIGTILLLFALAAQVTYQFRDLIAATVPASKDTLVTLCKLASCQIKLPAQLDAITYEADELHTLPKENTFEFGLLLRNHASLPQAWPHIELTLKDPKKQVVLRRVFTPSEYLSTPQDVLNGFQPNQEQAVKLYFVADKVKATDYVVAIFYP